MKLLQTLLCLMLLLSFTSDSSGAKPKHTKDSIKTVKQNLKKKKALLIDVREKKEWDAGHLELAQLVPLSKLQGKIDVKKLAKQLPKKKIIYCHCRSGGRVLKAAPILKKMGYDIRPLKQGYADLLKAGFKKAKKKPATKK